MRNCGTRVAPGCRQKPEGSCSQLFLGSCVLVALDRSLLGQEFKQKWWSHLSSQELCTPWRPALYQWDLVTKCCGTGSAPGTDQNLSSLSPSLHICNRKIVPPTQVVEVEVMTWSIHYHIYLALSMDNQQQTHNSQILALDFFKVFPAIFYF